MKTWDEVVVGDKTIARAATEKPMVVYGRVVDIKNDILFIKWEGYGIEFYYSKTADNIGKIHFYETEAEKLSLLLKLL